MGERHCPTRSLEHTGPRLSLIPRLTNSKPRSGDRQVVLPVPKTEAGGEGGAVGFGRWSPRAGSSWCSGDNGSERKNICCVVGAAGTVRRRCDDPLGGRRKAAPGKLLPRARCSLPASSPLGPKDQFPLPCPLPPPGAGGLADISSPGPETAGSFLQTGERKHVRGRTGQRNQSRRRMSTQSLPQALRQPGASEAGSRD